MAEKDEGFMVSFGDCILNVWDSLPLAGFAGHEELDIIPFEGFDLAVGSRRAW